MSTTTTALLTEINFESDVESHINAADLSELSDVFEDDEPLSGEEQPLPLPLSSLSINDISFSRDLDKVNVPLRKEARRPPQRVLKEVPSSTDRKGERERERERERHTKTDKPRSRNGRNKDRERERDAQGAGEGERERERPRDRERDREREPRSSEHAFRHSDERKDREGGRERDRDGKSYNNRQARGRPSTSAASEERESEWRGQQRPLDETQGPAMREEYMPYMSQDRERAEYDFHAQRQPRRVDRRTTGAPRHGFAPQHHAQGHPQQQMHAHMPYQQQHQQNPYAERRQFRGEAYRGESYRGENYPRGRYPPRGYAEYADYYEMPPEGDYGEYYDESAVRDHGYMQPPPLAPAHVAQQSRNIFLHPRVSGQPRSAPQYYQHEQEQTNAVPEFSMHLRSQAPPFVPQQSRQSAPQHASPEHALAQTIGLNPFASEFVPPVFAPQR